MTQLNLINLKKVFLYEIGLIAIREVSPPFDEEQQYWRPYQPKHSPSNCPMEFQFNYYYITRSRLIRPTRLLQFSIHNSGNIILYNHNYCIWPTEYHSGETVKELQNL